MKYKDLIQFDPIESVIVLRSADDQKKAEELGIGGDRPGMGKCIFTGPIYDRDALRAWNTRADLFLFPSLYDTFGLVIREAAVHRTPSLMMRHALCAKGIKEDVSGFLVDDTSPEAFALKIIEIMDNKTLYNSVCDHAEEDLGLTWKKLMPEVEDRYRSLIKHKQSK